MYDVIGCSIGRPKHVRVMAGALEGDTFIGPEAEVTFNDSLSYILRSVLKLN